MVKATKNKADDTKVVGCNQLELNGILYIMLRQMGLDGSIDDQGGRKQLIIDERAFADLPKTVQLIAEKRDGKIYLHAEITKKERKQMKKSKLALPKKKRLIL